MEKYTERHVQAIWYDALEIMDWFIPDEEEMTDENTDKVAE